MDLYWLLMAAVAWGALAFGAPYGWAYWPLLLAAATFGAANLTASPRKALAPHRAVVWGFVAIAAAVVVQLLPVSRDLLLRLGLSRDVIVLPRAGSYIFTVPTQVSNSLTIRPSSTLLGLAFVVTLAVFVFGASRYFSRYGVRRTAGGLAVLGLLLALIAIVQLPLFQGRIYGFWTPLYSDRAFGPFVNKNHFAGCILMVLAVSLGYFVARMTKAGYGVKGGWRQRTLWLSSEEANRLALLGMAILVMGISLVLSLSRSGITCLALATVLVGGWVLRRQPAGSRRTLASGFAVLVVVVGIGWVGFQTVAQRFAEAEPTLSTRIALWQDTLGLIRDYPIAGTGLNTYGGAMVAYQTVEPTVFAMEAHNDYLQLAAEGGLLLGIPILVTLGLFVREIRRRFAERRDEQVTYWIRVGAVVGLIAMALQETVEFSLQMPGNAVLFGVLAAVAMHRPSSP